MACNSETLEEMSILLMENQSFFQKDLPIINFITGEGDTSKKARICAWNEHPYDDQETHSKNIRISPSFENHKNRIQHFLATIRTKNGQFSRVRSINKNNKKAKNLDLNEPQKNDLYMPLSSTLITFPKSRSQCRKLQNEEKIILQKLYRKRQKSKVIPRQISINPTVNQTMKPVYPSKNYLSKNHSFIEEHSLKIHNPELSSKIIKNISTIKRQFKSSYYKKTSGVFTMNNLNFEKLIDFDRKSNFMGKNLLNFKQYTKKVNSLNDQNPDSGHSFKMYNTNYSSPRFNQTIFKEQNEFSIERVKENAKNSHLNRKMFFESDGTKEIQLMGSTITQWRIRAQQKLQKSDLLKD